MEDDHKYTKDGKKEISDSLINLEQQNSDVSRQNNELDININQESDFYDDYSTKINVLYANIVDQISEINNAYTDRLVLIVICYAVIILFYRFSLYLILKDNEYEYLLYFLFLGVSTYFVERRALNEVHIWSYGKLDEIRDGIKIIDKKGKNKIRLLENRKKINQLSNGVKEVVGISALFSGKIDRLLSYLDHQNTAQRVKRTIMLCCKRYNLIDDFDKEDSIFEPSYELKSEDGLRDFYLNEYSKKYSLDTYVLRLLYFDYVGDTGSLNGEWDQIKQTNLTLGILKILNEKQLILDYTSLKTDALTTMMDFISSMS